MPTNTLTDSPDDLDDTVATYVFDMALADSLLSASGLTLAASLAIVAALGLVGNGGAALTVATAVSIVCALGATWGVVIAASRRRRRNDRFVVGPEGLGRHQGTSVVHTRWNDVSGVTHSGSLTGGRMARWNGGDYRCRVDLRDGGTIVFDNYVVAAASLGHEIERRSSPA